MNSPEHIRARVAVAAVELIASLGCFGLSAYLYYQATSANNAPSYAVTQPNPHTFEPEQTIYDQHGRAILFCVGLTYQGCYDAAYPQVRHHRATSGKSSNTVRNATNYNNVSINGANSQSVAS